MESKTVEQIVDEIDFILIGFEDYMHDQEGKKITHARKLLSRIRAIQSIKGEVKFPDMEEGYNETAQEEIKRLEFNYEQRLRREGFVAALQPYQINDLSTTAVNKFPATCKTCAGTGIISEITGLPPSYSEPKERQTNSENLNVYNTRKIQ